MCGPPATASPIGWSLWRSRPICTMAFSIRPLRCASSIAGSRHFAWNCRCSRTVRSGMNISSWCMYAISVLNDSCHGLSFSRISPVAIGLCRASALSSEVLPAPLGPMIASSSPGAALPLTSVRMCFVPLSAFGTLKLMPLHAKPIDTCWRPPASPSAAMALCAAGSPPGCVCAAARRQQRPQWACCRLATQVGCADAHIQ